MIKTQIDLIRTKWKSINLPATHKLFNVNLFLFVGVIMYLRGDSLGVLPSREGFILIGKGKHYVVVSPFIWLFNLIYCGFTLLISPLVLIVFPNPRYSEKVKKMSWDYIIFILLVIFGYYYSVTGAFSRSLVDWWELTRANKSMNHTIPSGERFQK